MAAEQSQPAPQPIAQHPMADHCLFHLLGDIAHPVSVAAIQHVNMKPGWRNDASLPIVALDSPFKPPRA